MGVCQGNAYKIPNPGSVDDKSRSDQEKLRHTGSILGLSSIGEQIFSCSDDKSVVVSSWDYASNTKSANEPRDLTILRGHSRAVNCVTSFRDLSGFSKCWTASRDLSVKCVSMQRIYRILKLLIQMLAIVSF
jgi:WD40 repeat protein